jgi:hypothetical protein
VAQRSLHIHGLASVAQVQRLNTRIALSTPAAEFSVSCWNRCEMAWQRCLASIDDSEDTTSRWSATCWRFGGASVASGDEWIARKRSNFAREQDY